MNDLQVSKTRSLAQPQPDRIIRGFCVPFLLKRARRTSFLQSRTCAIFGGRPVHRSDDHRHQSTFRLSIPPCRLNAALDRAAKCIAPTPHILRVEQDARRSCRATSLVRAAGQHRTSRRSVEGGRVARKRRLWRTHSEFVGRTRRLSSTKIQQLSAVLGSGSGLRLSPKCSWLPRSRHQCRAPGYESFVWPVEREDSCRFSNFENIRFAPKYPVKIARMLASAFAWVFLSAAQTVPRIVARARAPGCLKPADLP